MNRMLQYVDKAKAEFAAGKPRLAITVSKPMHGTPPEEVARLLSKDKADIEEFAQAAGATVEQWNCTNEGAYWNAVLIPNKPPQ